MQLLAPIQAVEELRVILVTAVMVEALAAKAMEVLVAARVAAAVLFRMSVALIPITGYVVSLAVEALEYTDRELLSDPLLFRPEDMEDLAVVKDLGSNVISIPERVITEAVELVGPCACMVALTRSYVILCGAQVVRFV